MHSVSKHTFNRREKKYPLDVCTWGEVVDCAEQFLPAERFDGVHDLVNIRTTYMDTPDLDSYTEYQEARPVRRKVRIRQYGYNGQFNGKCWVELKMKCYRESLKRRFCCSTDLLTEFLDGRDILENVVELNAGRPDVADIYRATRALVINGRLRPVARVEYDRASFQNGRSSKARITVDRNIRFSTADDSAIVPHDGVILEVKYSHRKPGWFREFLEDLDLKRSSRFSKFASAIRELGATELWRRNCA